MENLVRLGQIEIAALLAIAQPDARNGLGGLYEFQRHGLTVICATTYCRCLAAIRGKVAR
jgi:hypothetical protein